MRRIAATPRADWQKKVEAAGLTWHTCEHQAYWNESAFYEFTAKEVDLLASATNELEEMTRKAAQRVIDHRLYSKMGIPELAVPLIERSWEAEPPSLYGRFDLMYDGWHPPKLLEYNADTPTSLLEAAVVQWYWLEETHSASDQFNSIHERLIALWRDLTPYIPGRRVDFCSMDDPEDWTTATYLEDTAQQAGLASSLFLIDEIGWDGGRFVGPDDQPLTTVFKLYPWEWMVREEFGKYLAVADTIWLEPPWKMLLSNKGILPVLWELYPNHPLLLAASFEPPSAGADWVRKPLLGREGANVTLHQAGRKIETSGDYGMEGFVYQDVAPLKDFDGMYPVIGSWVIGHEEGDSAAGIGIRESDTPITTNPSRFVPHLCG
ncbi:MAG: glutathionylspermidine synthase family protein [Bryobacteraceae bacterium]|jgi:glutathionylspermidine synthase